MTRRDGQFFEVTPLSLLDIAELTSACIPVGLSSDVVISGVSTLDRAGPSELTFLDNPSYRQMLQTSRAGACLVSSADVHLVPSGTVSLVVGHPYAAFAKAAMVLYPEAAFPLPVFGRTGIFPGATIHAEARLESGISIDPGVVIGPGVEIGEGSTVGANTVIGPHVRIGRNCHIGPNVTILHTLIGNQVIVHSGTNLGQDGFGFAIGREGHSKVPQIGRVIIQDHVELGAQVTIDRGGVRDTIIGEGSKIDNMVHIAHNVVIGRHCLIAAQTGIAGSTEVGDFCVIGGQVGMNGHIKIGRGTQIAGGSSIISDLPPGSKVGGYPAMPIKQWFRQVGVLRRLARISRGGKMGSTLSDRMKEAETDDE